LKKLIVCASTPSLVLAAAVASPAFAAPPASSAYVTDVQTTQVQDATSEGIGQVNMIACIMHAMRPDALVNQGAYLALIDKNKCDSEKRSSTANAGSTSDGAQAAASYVTATVDSTRASNSDPMIAKVWLDLDEEGMHQTIYVHVSATQAPSAANAYGVFRLDYCGKAEGMSGCPSRGYLEGTTSGLNFYQLDDDGSHSETTALRLVTASGASGSGRLQSDKESQGEHSAFTFGYDANLYRRADDNGEQCFSRDASDPGTGQSVWRYGLYEADTGARVSRNSGFPIEFATGGTTYNGYLGYYGLSLPAAANDALTNGSTVDKVDYSSGNSPTRTSYTVLKSPGRLTKYTRHTRTLHSMDKIHFQTFVDMNADNFFAGASPNTQYELYWDDASGHFVATGAVSCGDNGCQTNDLPSPQTVSLSYWTSRGGVQGWSQSLGGEVFINLAGSSEPLDSSSVQVVFRQQDLVYPGQLPATLFCVQNCPTQASMQAYFSGAPVDSPYVASSFGNWQPTPAASVVTYGTDAATATLRDNANAAVAYGSTDDYRQHPMYANGVMSGRLFTQLSDAECSLGSGTYCDWRVNDAEVYYQWQTGPNPWNQFAAVKDSSGNFVTFDAPLQLAYTVPSGTQYGQYAGKSLVLQYGGFGDLQGIPGVCVSRLTNAQVNCNEDGARYVPSFVIPYDATTGAVTDGSKTYLVKWLDREIRFAQKPLSACTNAGLTVPANVTLPTASDLKDPSDVSSDVYIGDKPTVTSAPRVIHGDVKY